MSSTKCLNHGHWCSPSYPVRDYFLALFAIVGTLLCLRLLGYAGYYLWLRYSSQMRRRDGGQLLQPNDDDHHVQMPYFDFRGPAGMNCSTQDQHPNVCVIVAGEDQPTFIAQPAPLAPARDYPSPVKAQLPAK